VIPITVAPKIFIGWDLLGYPGVRRVVATPDEVSQGSSFGASRQSAYDIGLLTCKDPSCFSGHHITGGGCPMAT